MVHMLIQSLGPSALSKPSGVNLPLSSFPWEGPSCSNASVFHPIFTIFCMYTPIDWTYKFNKKAVLSKHNTVIIMNTPMPSAISDKRLIPTLMPEMVDDVAIAVISQMMITWNHYGNDSAFFGYSSSDFFIYWGICHMSIIVWAYLNCGIFWIHWWKHYVQPHVHLPCCNPKACTYPKQCCQNWDNIDDISDPAENAITD